MSKKKEETGSEEASGSITKKTIKTTEKMKTWKIKPDGIEYKLAENANDLSVRRFAQLKVFLMQKQTGSSIPSIISAMQGFIKGFDAGSKSEMLITLYNYAGGLQKVEALEDADQLIFTVICLEPGEDAAEYDTTLAKEKLSRMNKEGLTQGQVVEEGTTFIKGSPILSSFYLVKSLLNLKD